MRYTLILLDEHEYLIDISVKLGQLQVERYDPQRDCWKTLPSLQKGRIGDGAAVLNGKIFVCGGENNNTVEVYDPIANRSMQR